jgi:hypothetical protein
MILGIPNARPAVIELFRNLLRVIVFIGLTINGYLRRLPWQRQFSHPKHAVACGVE